jgi:hypothetical protein
MVGVAYMIFDKVKTYSHYDNNGNNNNNNNNNNSDQFQHIF